MKKFAIGLSVAALALSGGAYAAQRDGRLNPDSNGDGAVTRAESQAHAKSMFAKMDANNDGKLDQTDFEAHREQMKAMMFDKLDANHDGSVSRDEFMAFEGPGKGHHHGMGGMGGPGMGGPGMGGPGMGGTGMGGTGMGGPGMDGAGMHHGKGMRGYPGMMMKADTDKDGAVSQAEFLAAADKRFDAADANHDGKITREERQAHRQQIRDKWRDRACD